MDTYDIFVSYSHEDRARVQSLVSALTAEGWKVFWDRTIPPGESWRTYIGGPLAQAPAVIVCWSRQSIDSDWVTQEADDAAKRKTLIPVMIDAVSPPLGLAHVHAADLVDWIAGNSRQLPTVLKLAIMRKLAAAAPGESGPLPTNLPAGGPQAQAPPPSPAGLRRYFTKSMAKVVIATGAIVAAGGVAALILKPPDASAPTQSKTPPPAGFAVWIFFGSDSADLTAQSFDRVSQAAGVIKASKVSRVRVDGHTDSSASIADSVALSLRRATAVRDALVAEGVTATAIEVFGRGKSRPLVQTADHVREPQNNRVEITIVQ